MPLASTKLVAAYSENGSIHLLYQAKDESIREILYSRGKGWTGRPTGDRDLVLGAGTAQPGTPLAVVGGGWSEMHAFCVNKANQVLEIYSNDRVEWVASESSHSPEHNAPLVPPR